MRLLEDALVCTIEGNAISCVSANDVARPLDQRLTEDWSQGDAATNAAFEPLETYAERLGALLAEVRALGFEAVDLWLAHRHPSWASDDHVGNERDLLGVHRLELVSPAGGFGADRERFLRSCRLAAASGVRVLGGDTPLLDSDRMTPCDSAAALSVGAHDTRRFGPARVAIVCAGAIAAPYAATITTFPETTLVGVNDVDAARAEAFAAEHACQVYPTLDALLADDGVDLVVNLTIHHAHEAVTRCCGPRAA